MRQSWSNCSSLFPGRRPVRTRPGNLTCPRCEPFPPRPAGLKEAQRLSAVADQHVLGLLIMIQHHLVRLTADARLLVAADRRVRRIGVIAVGPYAPGLDAAAKTVR